MTETVKIDYIRVLFNENEYIQETGNSKSVFKIVVNPKNNKIKTEKQKNHTNDDVNIIDISKVPERYIKIHQEKTIQNGTIKKTQDLIIEEMISITNTKNITELLEFIKVNLLKTTPIQNELVSGLESFLTSTDSDSNLMSDSSLMSETSSNRSTVSSVPSRPERKFSRTLPNFLREGMYIAANKMKTKLGKENINVINYTDESGRMLQEELTELNSAGIRKVGSYENVIYYTKD